MELTVGSLFAGIGGFDLGLERAGMRVVWQCEADEFCAAVLTRHWPGIPCYPDVRRLDASRVAAVDVLCGGFPCQDISYAGKGAGIGGERSGLWAEFARLIRDLRPRWVIVENVPALLARGLDVVLGDLAACGYDAEWDCIPAAAVGAPHRRDRIWIVAYPVESVADAAGQRRERALESRGSGWQPEDATSYRSSNLADADRARPAHVQEGQARAGITSARERDDPAVGGRGQPGRTAVEWWATEPDVGRVAHGVPLRVDRLRALGNALVPQVAELIGRRIVEWEAGA